MPKKYLEALIDLLMPNHCVSCKTVQSEGLCHKCVQQVVYLKDNFCPICGRPHKDEKNNLLCPHCIGDKPKFLFCRSAFSYDGPIKDALHHLKFEGRSDLAGPLAKLLIQYIDRHCPEVKYSGFDRVASVPVGKKKMAKRGYNQAAIFAEALSKRLAIPNGADILVRVKETKPQFNLNREERLQNLDGAFAVQNHHLVAGQRLLLVDDIFTTGATVTECTRVLLQAGAKKVSVITLARSKDEENRKCS